MPPTLCVMCRGTGGCIVAAAQNGHVACLELLIGDGALAEGTDAQGRTAVFACAVSNRFTVMNRLMQSQAFRGTVNTPCTAQRRTPLHAAAAGNHVQIVERLKVCGADPNLRDAEGSTPLMVAARENAYSALRALRPITDQDLTDNSGRTALFVAVASGSVRATRWRARRTG